MPDKVGQPTAPRFFRRGRLSERGTLALRGFAVVALIAIALGGHWFDRAGLKDNVDGHVSFIDVVYFTAITVTTVGYGDIIPVTDRARLFDTFVVTPIRIFIWLIFLGSAYSFVLRQGWERWRMGFVQRSLSGHSIVCGFGSTGSSAVAELLARGCAPETIVVIDENANKLREAEALGVATVEGDASHNAVLEAAGIDRARAVIVTPGRDDSAILIMLSARRLAPHIPVSVGIRATENEEIAREAGADVIINSVSLGGQLLAGSTAGPNIADYVADLVTRGGRVELRERTVSAEECGCDPASLRDRQIVRIYRDGKPIGFWEDGARRLEPGDHVIEIVPAKTAIHDG